MTRIISSTMQPAGRSGVPKAVQGSGHGGGDLGRSRARSAQTLLNARTQAREIIASAQAVGRTESQRAWELGYQAGLAQAQAEQAPLTEALSGVLAGAVQDYQRTVRAMDESVLELVLEICRAVLPREAAAQPEALLPVVRAALRDLSLESMVSLRVHPSHAEVLNDQRLHLGLPASVELRIVGDPAMAPGGCLIESGAGRVDATIDTQLARIRQTLREALHAS
jgi:flagellar assembly protein FliH